MMLRGPNLALNCGVLRVVRIFRLLHRVQMIEIAVELIEPVDGGQVGVAVAEMVLADLAGGVAVGLEQTGDGRLPVLNARRGTGKPTLNNPVRNGCWPVMNAARPAVQDCCA